MTDFDPYATLGVGRKAMPDAVKRAYRRRATAAHPDRAGGNASDMANINRAYALLSDDGARARYDASGDLKPAPSREFVANELISTVVVGWLQQDAQQVPELLPFVLSNLAQHGGNITAELGKRQRGVAKVNRELKRLTRKGARPADPIRGVFDQALKQYETQIEQLTEQQAVAKLALEIVQEYGVTAERAQGNPYLLGAQTVSGWRIG